MLTSMNIGFLGAGSVAQTLGRAFAALGHDIAVSNRSLDAQKLSGFLADTAPRSRLVSFEQAAAFGDVVIPAIQPWTALCPLLERIGQPVFSGKIVIDLGNAVDWTVKPPQPALPGSSLGEHVQAWLPGARVVKTLNFVAASRMAHPQFTDGTPSLLVAGNDSGAKQTVAGLLRELGWKDVIDLGDIRQSQSLEALMLAVLFSEIATKSRGTAFSLLRK